MATATDSTGFCAGTKERLRNLFDELGLADLLELDEPWTVRDCERDQVEMAQNLNKLLALEVVEVVGEEEVKWDGQTQFDAINKYEFDDRARELLEDYREERNELPCGCHAHVHWRSDGLLGCRYCDDVSFDREVVDRAMSQRDC